MRLCLCICVIVTHVRLRLCLGPCMNVSVALGPWPRLSTLSPAPAPAPAPPELTLCRVLYPRGFMYPSQKKLPNSFTEPHAHRAPEGRPSSSPVVPPSRSLGF